jgi:hypothetical protein
MPSHTCPPNTVDTPDVPSSRVVNLPLMTSAGIRLPQTTASPRHRARTSNGTPLSTVGALNALPATTGTHVEICAQLRTLHQPTLLEEGEQGVALMGFTISAIPIRDQFSSTMVAS